jgi:hypothetical protein
MLILMRAGFGGQHVTKECTIIQCERLSRTRNLQSAIRKHKHKRVPQNSQMGISRTAQLKKKKSLSFFVCVVQTTTMSSSKKKDRKQRHTVNLARSSGSNVTSPESKSERQKFLARLSVALPSDAAADDDDNNDERREIEHLFSQLPPLDSPKRSARGATSPRNNDDDPDARDERRRHGRGTHHRQHRAQRALSPSRPSSSSSAGTSGDRDRARRRSNTIGGAAISPSASPRLPSLEELGVPLPPVVVHMLELDRAKERDKVKSMLKQCSKEDRTRFKYELHRRRQAHALKKAENAAAAAGGRPLAASSSVAESKARIGTLERAKTATGAINERSRKASTVRDAHELRPSSASSTSTARAVQSRPTANTAPPNEADVIRRLSVNSSLKRILSGYVDDEDSTSDPPPPPVLVQPVIAASPRNDLHSNNNININNSHNISSDKGRHQNGVANGVSPRLSVGGITATTRAPPIAPVVVNSDSDSEAPPLPPSSTAPTLDLDQLLGV